MKNGPHAETYGNHSQQGIAGSNAPIGEHGEKGSHGMRGKNGAIGGDGGNGANLTIKFKGNAAFIKLMQKNISYSIEGRLGSSPRNSGEAGTGGKGDISKGGQGGYRGKNDLGGTPGHGGNGFIWI